MSTPLIQSTPVDISIIIPVYYNEGCLTPTLDSLHEAVILQNPDLKFEVFFVDDGSQDRSLEEILSLREKYPDLVRGIKLTRNFGQASAILAGMRHARGERVVIMSADGQDPPELINDMIQSSRSEGYEIVIATREGRDESLFRVLTSKLFYHMMRKLAFPSMPEGGFDFVLMGRRALQAFLRNYDANPFFQGQIMWTGFKIKQIGYHRRSRITGTSRWTFGRKMTYLLDGLMAYSYFPIRVMSLTGGLFALLGFLYALTVLVAWVAFGNPVKGWSPLMIVILITSGVQMLMVGIVGEYLWRTLAQVRNREHYIVETTYGFDKPFNE
ncbi:MAG: glycosyltransferase family 2 protein [Candidatus Sumerlaeaceae bacterium]|nr:glycosyltransferase family 2 protein [Candidatus Sumerlaeaceae bacterium]